MLGEKVLPTDSFVRTWRSGLGGTISVSLRQALLLPVHMEHYSSYRDVDLVLKLQWNNIAVSTLSFSYPFLFYFPFFLKCYFSIYTNSLIISVIVPVHPTNSRYGGSTERCHEGSGLGESLEVGG